MRVLDRKLVRNLREMKSQALAIVLIIACGVGAFVTVLTAYRGLKGSRDDYYVRYRMADIWAPLERAPRRITRDLETIPGVRRVESRIEFEVTIDLPELDQPCSGRVLSAPDVRRRILNDLHLARGRWFEGDGTREVLVAERFAKIHGLDVGDRLMVIMNNKKEALRIVGLALSPEFVYLIRGAGQILPDARHFTVLWLSETFAESVFDFKDACNSILVGLDRGADAAAAIDALDEALDRYGSFGAYERADQLSNRYLSNEIDGLKGTATMIPTIFLGVAAFVLFMLMDRLVRTQRTQIAMFRAFGYRRRDLNAHFLKLALLIGTVGALLGIGMGVWFAASMVELYREFYSFPVLKFDVDPIVVGASLIVSLLFSSLGALGAMRAIIRLTPADGLRPEAPAIYRKILFERHAGFIWRRLSFAPRMVLRSIARRKLRAAVTIGGVAMSASIMLLALFSPDSIDILMDTQWRLVERQDIKVTFHNERGRAALYDLKRLEGVRSVEPELGVPVRLRHGRHEKRTGLTGLQPGQSLQGLIDNELRTVAMPTDGLLLSRKLADILHVRPGDEIEVEVLNGRQQIFRAPIENVVDEYIGAFAYAEIGRLSRWIQEEFVLTGARLLVDPARARELGRELKELPAVAAVDYKAQMLQIFRDTLAASQAAMNAIVILFAGIITFGVTYNTARISLSERSRELASMRVLGFTTREVSAVLSLENFLLSGAALVPGIGLGIGFIWLLTKLYETDLFRFPFIIRADSVAWTVVIVMGFTVLANLLLRRRTRELDLVEVLKARE